MRHLTLSTHHYQLLGKIITCLPEGKNEVECKRIEEIFNNEEIVSYSESGEMLINISEFLKEYPTVQEAEYFLNEIQRVQNFIVTGERYRTGSEDTEVREITLGENTGGNVMNDIITLKNSHVLVITGDGVFLYKDHQHYNDGEDLKSFIYS